MLKPLIFLCFSHIKAYICYTIIDKKFTASIALIVKLNATRIPSDAMLSKGGPRLRVVIYDTEDYR